MTILLLTLQLVLGDTTHDPYPYLIKPSEKFDWKRYEIAVAEKYKDSILDTFKPDYEFYFNPDYEVSEKFSDAFHFVDLNNDRLPDVVYDGRSGGEGGMVHIYMHRQFRMEKVFGDIMTILAWTFTDKKLRSIVTYDYGCCAEVVNLEKHYTVDAKFNFSLARQRAILSGMVVDDDDSQTPDKFFEKPLRFKTINKDYALRFSPEISDELPYGLEEKNNKGNIISLYPQGAEGIAWGYKKDSTGREWWLVEMAPQKRLSFTQYWHSYEEPTYQYGWMSSRFLERLQ